MLILIILIICILIINHCYYLYCINDHNYHKSINASVNIKYVNHNQFSNNLYKYQRCSYCVVTSQIIKFSDDLYVISNKPLNVAKFNVNQLNINFEFCIIININKIGNDISFNKHIIDQTITFTEIINHLEH